MSATSTYLPYIKHDKKDNVDNKNINLDLRILRWRDKFSRRLKDLVHCEQGKDLILDVDSGVDTAAAAIAAVAVVEFEKEV